MDERQFDCAYVTNLELTLKDLFLENLHLRTKNALLEKTLASALQVNNDIKEGA
jgi:hypothetical protein